MSTLEELERRIAKLERQINQGVAYQLNQICEILNVSREDVWVHRLGSPIHQEARDRTWLVLHSQGKTLEEMALFTGYSESTIQRRLNKYKEYLSRL